MSAPTEQEVREAIGARWAEKAGVHDIYHGDEVLSTLITGLQFAAEYPDAPRAREKVPA